MTDLHPSHVRASGRDNVTGLDINASACGCDDPLYCRCRCHRTRYAPRRLVVSERRVEPRTMLQAHPQTDPVRYEEPGWMRRYGGALGVILVLVLLLAIGVQLGELPW